MKSAKIIFVFVFMTCLSGFTANAALINYSENIDGELSFASTTFNFDTAGTNTVSGSSSLINGVFDNDTFFFDLAAGLEITNFSFVFFNGVQSNIDFRPQFALAELGGPTTLQNAELIISTGITNQLIVPASLPYAFPSYRLALGGTTFGTPGTIHSATYDWTMTVETGSIPEPTTLAIFGLGLAGLGFMRRRRRVA